CPGRPGRGGRLPGREHPGRHGRPQEPQVPALRLGRGPAPPPAPPAGARAAGGGGAGGGAWRPVLADGGPPRSPNAGRMEAAFAGAFGVRLGGRNDYGDRVEDRPTLGAGSLPGPDDVDRAVRLSLLIGVATAALATMA